MNDHDAGSSGLDREAWDELRTRLARSRFRSRFRLNERDAAYAADRGIPTLRTHAYEFVGARLAPAAPKNDGRQTPMRGHPVFVAQHATATCCRGCLRKWHGIPAGRALTEDEIRYTVDVIAAWLGAPPAGDGTGATD
ncbi:DUF4186 domain-containing protein [Halofilum ochraceum]|uniref:DUF4186 domain-containing protein n=1 Tax=Halofilum ochraceum TaxID=1611323 RepID=UPI0008DA6F1F|nr:DUF4186 domain-containing protein [Halofilum ochraceum]